MKRTHFYQLFKIGRRSLFVCCIRVYATIVLAGFLGEDSYGQPPEVVWQKTYGEGVPEYAYDIEPTLNNKYLIAGRTIHTLPDSSYFRFLMQDSLGYVIWIRHYDVGPQACALAVLQTADLGYVLGGYIIEGVDQRGVILKTDPNGNLLWTYMLMDQVASEIQDIRELSDGRLIATGYIQDSSGNRDLLLLALTPQGSRDYLRQYGEDGDEQGYSIVATSDDYLCIAASKQESATTDDGLWMVKMNQEGDTVWTRSWNGPGRDFAYGIAEAPNGDFIFCGTRQRFVDGPFDGVVIRYDSSGSFQWLNIYQEYPQIVYRSVTVTEGGDIFAGGWADATDMIVTKIESDGDEVWSQLYGGDQPDSLYAILATEEGGCILTGQTESFDTEDSDIYTLKIDGNGEVSDSSLFGRKTFQPASKIGMTADNALFLLGGGLIHSAGFGAGTLCKVDILGNLLWKRYYGSSEVESLEDGVNTSDGGFILVGTVYPPPIGPQDVYVVRADSDGWPLWTSRIPTGLGTKGIEIRNGEFIVVSKVWNFGQLDIGLFGFDDFGNTTWERNYGSSQDDIISSAVWDPQAGLILAGSYDEFSTDGPREGYIMCVDSEGDSIWGTVIEGGIDEFGSILSSRVGSIIPSENEGYMAFGEILDQPSMIRFDNDGDTLWTRVFDQRFTRINGYSIPSSSDFYVRFIGDTSVARIDSVGRIYWKYYPSSFGAALGLSETELIISGSIDEAPSYRTPLLAMLESGSALPQLAVSEKRLYFGSVIPESTSTKDMTIWNSGTLPVTVDSIVVPPEITYRLVTPTTIEVDGRLDLEVSFTPQAEGFLSDSLYIYCTAQQNLNKIRLSGSAWYPHIEVLPDSLSFGYLPLEAESTFILQATSVGIPPLTILRVETPLGYSTSFEGPATIEIWTDPPIEIPVTFAPNEAQHYEGDLLVISNAEEDTFSIPLYGIGAVRILTTDVDTLNFGSVTVGEDSSRQLVVRNTGTQPLTVNSIDVPDGYTSIFSQPVTVPPGGMLGTPIRFTPDTIRAFEGFCEIRSDATDSLVSVWLIGIGVPSQSVEDPLLVPTKFSLDQNFPNPFNSETTIRFDIPVATEVSITICDLLGRTIDVLTRDVYSPGRYNLVWDACEVSSGVYFIMLQSQDHSLVRKVLLIR